MWSCWGLFCKNKNKGIAIIPIIPILTGKCWWYTTAEVNHIVSDGKKKKTLKSLSFNENSKDKKMGLK